jgi:hypothetical protein
MKESSMFTPELSFKISLLCFLCLFVATSFVAYFAASLRPAFRLSQFMIALNTRK